MSSRPLLASTLAIALFGILSAGGCRGLVGIEDDPPTSIAPAPTPTAPPVTPVCGGYSYAQPKCATCANTKCCADATACMADSECALVAKCQRECAPDDAECLLRCELGHPDGVAHQRALSACVTRECAASCIPPRWACLDPARKELPATGPPIKVTYRVIDFPYLKRIEGMKIDECLEGADPECTKPVRSETTNASGEATFDVDGNVFERHVVVSGNGYVPTLVYLPRLTRSFVATIGVATLPTLLGVADSLETSVTSGSGHVLVNVVDCVGGAAAGVTLGLEPKAGFTQFYFSGGRPVRASPTVQTTDADPDTGAIGGFLNVPPGSADIRATVAQNGLAYARLNAEGATVDSRRVYVVKDRITFVLLHAAPQ